MKKLLVVSSIYNEEENVEEFVNEIYIQFEKFKQDLNFPLNLELILANNKSKDKSLEKMVSLKKKYSFLRVFDNAGNYGFDISVLNILKNNLGDFILILCSDLEDPPKLGFEMLSELVNNNKLDACLALKRDSGLSILNFFRGIYYVMTSFSTRTILVRGFHGFGVYRPTIISNAIIYAKRANPDIRKSLLWSVVNYKKYKYFKRTRKKGISSYSLINYFQEGINQFINSPSLSSRISLRVAFFSIILLITLMIFFFINYFAKILIFPGGITTILLITLFSSSMNYFLFALNAKQIEKIVLPNTLEIASANEIEE